MLRVQNTCLVNVCMQIRGTMCSLGWQQIKLVMLSSQVSECAEGRELVLQLLGLRLEGTAAAAVLPNLLTATLFLGPLSLLALKWRSGEPIEQVNRNPLQVGAFSCNPPRQCVMAWWYTFMISQLRRRRKQKYPLN